MDDTYVEARENVIYVRGSRVPIESLIWPWRDGHSAEEIQEAYSTLSLAEVYGALAFYLDHRAEIDGQMQASAAGFEAQRAESEAASPTRYAALRQRLAAAQARRASAQPTA